MPLTTDGHTGLLSSVYVIASAGRDCHKIGVSVDPCGRLGELQIGSPDRLSLVFTATSDHQMVDWAEASIHRLMRRRCVSGEWFTMDRDEAIACVFATVFAASAFREATKCMPRSREEIARYAFGYDGPARFTVPRFVNHSAAAEPL